MTEGRFVEFELKPWFVDDQVEVIREKVIEAEKKISELNSVVVSFQKNGIGKLVEIDVPNPEGMRVYAYKSSRGVPAKIYVAIGSILHLMRSSLDNIAWYCAGQNGVDLEENGKNISFPIRGSKESFESAECQKKMAFFSSDIRRIISEIKPYRGANELLYLLHDLNIKDKHKRALKMGVLSGFKTSFKKGYGGGYIRRIIQPHSPKGFFEDGEVCILIDADYAIELEAYDEILVFSSESGFASIPVLFAINLMLEEVKRVSKLLLSLSF